MAVQHERLPRLVSEAQLPSSLRDAASALTRIKGALMQIGATLRRARRAGIVDAEVLALGRRLAPRIRDLQTLRRTVIEGLSSDDLVLIAGREKHLALVVRRRSVSA